MNNFQPQQKNGGHMAAHHHYQHLQTQQLNLKSNKSAAQAAVKMLHTNSNVSKNPKLVTDSVTATAIGASSTVGTATAVPERQYNSGQRGKSYNSAIVTGPQNSLGQGIELGNPRISEKLKSIDGQTTDILKLNTDSMPLSPDACNVNDNRFSLNNGTNNNETKTTCSVLQYHQQLNKDKSHIGPDLDASVTSQIVQLKTSVNPQSFPDSFHNNNNYRSQNNSSNLNNDFGMDLSKKLNAGSQDGSIPYYKSQTGPTPQINTNTFINNYNTAQSNIKSDGTISPKNHHEQTQGIAISNQGDATAVVVGRQKRNRSKNQSNLDNNNKVLSSDVTLMSPMGIFDDPIENNGNHPDKDQSTSFDGVFMGPKNTNNNTQNSKSTFNRKDRRAAPGFSQKKELQLHTTIRKGKNAVQNPYILSPDKVKFTQENIQQRFEEDENDIIFNMNNGATAAMTNKRRVTGVATADQSLQNIDGGGGRQIQSTTKNNNPDDIAANLSLHIEKLPIKVNTSSIVTLSHHHNQHRKNSQSRTLHRNLDSDMRQANQNYDQKTRSMLTNGHQNQQNDISTFLQNNYGSFKSVHGASATVGNTDLRGIGKLAAELAQSQDAKKIVNSFTQNNSVPTQNTVEGPTSNSHPSAQRKIESSFNSNSYINNSSVAKTSMQKRRNISFGGAGTNNYINDNGMQNQSEKPNIIDLETSSGVTTRVSRPKPLMNSTYEGAQQLQDQQAYLISQTSNVTPHNKLINLTNESRNVKGIRSQDSGNSQRNSKDVKIQKKNQTNPEIISKKFTHSAPQQSHKYHPQQQSQFQQNISNKNSNDPSNNNSFAPSIQLFNQYMSESKQQPQQMPSSLSGIAGANQYSFDSTQNSKTITKTQKAQIRPGISSSATPCLPNQRNRHCSDQGISGNGHNPKGQQFTSSQNYYGQAKRRGGGQGSMQVEDSTITSPSPGPGSIAWEDRTDKAASAIDTFGPALINHSNGQDIEDFSQMIYRQDYNKTYQWDQQGEQHQITTTITNSVAGMMQINSQNFAKNGVEIEDQSLLMRRMGSSAAQNTSYGMSSESQGLNNQVNNNNILEQNNNYLLQKYMNVVKPIQESTISNQYQMLSPRKFGGFRTADGASQGAKIHHMNYLNHQIGGSDDAAASSNIGLVGPGTAGHLPFDMNMKNMSGYEGMPQFPNIVKNRMSRINQGPQSPESNQSFRIYVENRRARPKIVKTSHDHGNIFFAQQANSLKNSSQIGQRKDLASKMLPYQVLQSRGGDIQSFGGITSASTAFGNNDGISQENRSGYQEIVGGGHVGVSANVSTNNYSQQNGNGNVGGDLYLSHLSHKSISDKERTPTNGQEQEQFLKINNPKLFQFKKIDMDSPNNNTVINTAFQNNNNNIKKEGNLIKEDGEAQITNSNESKGKNPYYFTFFNEKNEQSGHNNVNEGSNQGDSTEQQKQQQVGFDSAKSDTQNQGQQQQQPSSMFTLNYHQTLDQDTRRVNHPIRGNHHPPTTTQQNTAIVNGIQSNSRESELVNNMSRIQKHQLMEPEPTPSFISQKQASANTQNSKPRNNEGAGDSINNTKSNSYQRKRMSQNRAIISSHNTGFIGNDDVNATEGIANIESNNVSKHIDLSNNSALNDSIISVNRDQSLVAPIAPSGALNQTHDQQQPSYTPVRRNPGQAYQRTKPQSPKILLPQCFLDQPLNQILQNNGTSATNATGNQKLNNRECIGSQLEEKRVGGSSILSTTGGHKNKLASVVNKPKIGETQPPQLNNIAVGPVSMKFSSKLGTTSISKTTPN